jgi:hypothetical protein
MSKDKNDLKVLAFFYFLLAGLLLLVALGCLVYFVIGVALLMDPDFHKSSAIGLGNAFGAVIAVVFLFLFLVSGTYAVLCFLAARKMRRRVNRDFSVTVAALICILFPVGTLLGVFSLRILNRPSMLELYRLGEWHGNSPF